MVVGLILRKLKLVGEVMVIVGTRVWMTEKVDWLLFPATSVTITLIEFAPGVSGTMELKLDPFTIAGTPLQVTPAIPESVSLTDPVTETDDTKILAPALGDTIMTPGGVLSSLTTTAVVAVFPALSVAIPTTSCPAVSVEIVTGVVQDSIPLVKSEQVKEMVGSDLCHPAELGAGVTMLVILGRVLSTPMICRIKLVPGALRNSTDNWLTARRVTGFVISVTLELKSLGPTTVTPLSLTIALETLELSIRNV
jgi:hypothetical protein